MSKHCIQEDSGNSARMKRRDTSEETTLLRCHGLVYGLARDLHADAPVPLCAVDVISNAFDSVFELTGPPAHPIQKHVSSAERTCPVCYDAFIDNSEQRRVRMSRCGHSLCLSCFMQYTKAKIETNEIHPWLVCPAETCKAFATPGDITVVLQSDQIDASVRLLVKFLLEYVEKLMNRNPRFVKCCNASCEARFLAAKTGSVRVVCSFCSLQQMVSMSKVEIDSEFKNMIEAGILRPCPKCSTHQMRVGLSSGDSDVFQDKGMCNVMHCASCGIFWNWRDRSTGSTYAEMKERARMMGTMWEPGELEFQRRLERENPEEFKRLLEKNGIRYDPNFVRGRS